MIIRTIKNLFTRKVATATTPAVTDRDEKLRQDVQKGYRKFAASVQPIKPPEDFPYLRQEMALSKQKEEDARLEAEADAERANQRTDRRGGSAGQGSGGGPAPRPAYTVLRR
jgi:hypothetical protein